MERIASPRKAGESQVRAARRTAAAAPMKTVPNDGVRWRGWMRANARGSAPWTLIDSVARELPTTQVSSAEIADTHTASWTPFASAVPRTGGPSADRTSAALPALPSPRPEVPVPAKPIAATAVNRYVTRRTSVEMSAALPGVRSLSRVSSLTVSSASQPQ